MSSVQAKEQHLSTLLIPLLNCIVDMVFNCHLHIYFQIHSIGLIPTPGLIFCNEAEVVIPSLIIWWWSPNKRENFTPLIKIKGKVWAGCSLPLFYGSFQPRLFCLNHIPQQAPLVPHSYPMCGNGGPTGLCRCRAVELLESLLETLTWLFSTTLQKLIYLKEVKYFGIFRFSLNWTL